jgi:hypothetical protein
MPLPGGIAAAHAALDDRTPADRSRFVIEIIHRLHGGSRHGKADPQLQIDALLTALDRGAQAATAAADTVPLPLPPGFWIDTVFAGRASPETLAASILRSRSASLLYYALMATDDETRAWLARQPALVADIAARASGPFAVAAPALRIAGDTVLVPGGKPAEAAWEAVIGQRVTDPAAFVRAVVMNAEGRHAYFLAAMGQLTSAQITFALRLGSLDPATSVGAARRLYAVFEKNASGWKLEERPLWRPPLDPGLLLADLAADHHGVPHLPGTQRFWELALADGDQGSQKPRDGAERSALVAGDTVDFVWICERLFNGSQTAQRRPYEVVLFASRVIRKIDADTVIDALDTVRGAGTYQSLFYVLERARLADPSAYAKAARRAASLAAVENHVRAVRALAQFQGAVVLLTRAAARHTISSEALAAAVTSLADVELNDRGEYDGRIGRWLLRFVSAQQASTGRADPETDHAGERPLGWLEERVIALVSGPSSAAQVIEWEGIRYRVDAARAETARLNALVGQDGQPFLSAAARLLLIADALSSGAGSPAGVRAQADALKDLTEALRAERAGEWDGSDAPGRVRAAATSLLHAPEAGLKGEAARVAAALIPISDDLLGRGLMQIAYAIALGQPDRALVSAGDAASRHDFALRVLGFGRLAAWRYPASGTERGRDWHVKGSLLGLDLRLADFSLMPLSSRPPAVRPSFNDAARRVFVETAVLAQPSAFRDDEREAIVAAMQRGRERLAAVHTSADAVVIADEIRLGPIRRTLLSWVALADAGRLSSFLSPTELFWLGWGDQPVPDGFQTWGTSAAARTGCDCLQLLNRRSWESLAGRWDSGVPATAFADLNLRLAELLRELRMPAALLASVLPAATFDFINNATSRWHDDERGLVTYVQTLPVDRVEQYLSLLTGSGPLFPVSDGSDMPTVPVGSREVPR